VKTDPLATDSFSPAANGRLRIAIPIANGCFSEHFGAARQFLFADADEAARRIDRHILIEAPEHRPGVLPPWLAERGADVVVAGSIGQRALLMLAEAGISVRLAGAGQPDPLLLALACIGGELPSATSENSRCDGGHHHDHDGHCH
jgi:predicted Fe-Mo cluster-binding NifX family protein